MPDWVRRALRTLLQITVVEAVIQLLLVFGVPITPAQHTAIIALATPFVTAAQNALEDHVQAFPAILKAPASDGAQTR